MSPLWFGFLILIFSIYKTYAICYDISLLFDFLQAFLIVLSNEEMWNDFYSLLFFAFSLIDLCYLFGMGYLKYVCAQASVGIFTQMETFQSVLLLWYWIRWMSLLGKTIFILSNGMLIMWNKNVIFLKETKMKSQNKIIEISGKSLRGIYLDKNKIISRKIEWMRPKFTILSYKSIGYYER